MLTDFEAYLARWAAGPIGATPTSTSATDAGSQFVVTARVGPFRVRSPYEVLAWAPPLSFSGRGVAGPVRFEEEYQLSGLPAIGGVAHCAAGVSLRSKNSRARPERPSLGRLPAVAAKAGRQPTRRLRPLRDWRCACRGQCRYSCWVSSLSSRLEGGGNVSDGLQSGQADCGRVGAAGIVCWMTGALDLRVGELLEREQGLAMLARVLHGVVRSGAGRLVFVAGEAGVG